MKYSIITELDIASLVKSSLRINFQRLPFGSAAAFLAEATNVILPLEPCKVAWLLSDGNEAVLISALNPNRDHALLDECMKAPIIVGLLPKLTQKVRTHLKHVRVLTQPRDE